MHLALGRGDPWKLLAIQDSVTSGSGLPVAPSECGNRNIALEPEHRCLLHLLWAARFQEKGHTTCAIHSPPPPT